MYSRGSWPQSILFLDRVYDQPVLRMILQLVAIAYVFLHWVDASKLENANSTKGSLLWASSSAEVWLSEIEEDIGVGHLQGSLGSLREMVAGVVGIFIDSILQKT